MIEVGKKYVTRGGYDVRIYATDGAGIHSVQGAINMGDGYGWRSASWSMDGAHSPVVSGLDLVAEDEILEVWINLYPNSVATCRANKRDAINTKDAGIIAIIGIEFITNDEGKKEARIIEVM